MKARSTLLTIALTALTVFAHAQWTKLTTTTYDQMDMSDIYANGSKIIGVGYTIPGFQAHVLTSTNDGQSWDTTQPIQQGVLFTTIAFKDADTGFIGGFGSKTLMMRTTDGGLHWNFYMEDTSNAGIRDMQFVNAKIGMASGYSTKQFTTGQCYRTTDGGNTWDSIKHAQLGCLDTLPVDFMQFIDAQTGWGWADNFSSMKSIMKTIDGGKSWTLQYRHTTSLTGFHFWNANNGIMVDANGEIYKTTNGGQNWLKQANKVPSGLYMAMNFLNQTTGFIVGWGCVFKTTDGGQNWTKETNIPASAVFAKIRFYDNRGYAIAQDGTVIRSAIIPNNVNEVLPLNEQLSIYPNPANTELNISSYNGAYKNIAVAVQDMNGRTVLEGKTDKALLHLNTAAIPAGIYTLQIIADGHNTSSKISIAH